MAKKSRDAFTLMEMLVALSVLVIMMGAIGEIFRIAGNASASGQATLNVMASVRVTQGLMAQDVGGLNTNGYLVIRQRWYIPPWYASYQYQPGDEVVASGTAYPLVAGTTKFYVCLQANTATSSNLTNATLWQQYTLSSTPSTDTTKANSIAWRADQVAFLANGNFQSRTGDSTNDIYNYLTSNAAAIWYGQLCISYGGSINGSTPPTLPQIGSSGSYYPAYLQNSFVSLGTAPTGNGAAEFILGREAILLTPLANSYYGVSYFKDVNYLNASTSSYRATPWTSADVGLEQPYITSSRVDTAGITPDQIMQTIDGQNNPASAAGLKYIDDNYCYRFATVHSPMASEVDAVAPPSSPTPTQIAVQLTNGYLRMMPILLQGVPSFAADWTDGSINSTTHQLNWYGLDNLDTAVPAQTPVQPGTTNNDHNDNAMYAFFPGNKYSGTTLQWPLALRFTYTITDPANRLAGGRAISQIIYLPH